MKLDKWKQIISSLQQGQYVLILITYWPCLACSLHTLVCGTSVCSGYSLSNSSVVWRLISIYWAWLLCLGECLRAQNQTGTYSPSFQTLENFSVCFSLYKQADVVSLDMFRCFVSLVSKGKKKKRKKKGKCLRLKIWHLSIEQGSFHKNTNGRQI